MNIFEIVKKNDLKELKEQLKYCYINSIDENSFSFLHYAVKNNNLSIVKYLILNGIDVNIRNNNLNSAIHLSIIGNNLGIFKTLIKANADINLLNSNNETPLMVAVRLGRKEMINILLSLNVATNLKNSNDENIMFLAVKTNDLDLIKNLFHLDKELINSKNINGECLLHEAVRSNNLDVVKLLIDYKLLPNLMNNDLETPLFFAARQSNIEMANLLINNGALIEFRNRFNEKIFNFGNLRFRDYLLFKSKTIKYYEYKKNYPLIISIILNNDDLFFRNLNRVEIEKKDDLNNSAIDYAKLYNRQKYYKIIKDIK